MQRLLISAALVPVALLFLDPAVAQTRQRQGEPQAGQQRAAATQQDRLVPVATFQQQVTGVTVSEDGRDLRQFPALDRRRRRFRRRGDEGRLDPPLPERRVECLA